LLETGIYENKEVEELKKKIQSFEKHYDVWQKQREKFKEEIKTSHLGAGVLVIDFHLIWKWILDWFKQQRLLQMAPKNFVWCKVSLCKWEWEQNIFYFDIIYCHWFQFQSLLKVPVNSRAASSSCSGTCSLSRTVI
jgi:hypothetical protein